MEFHIKKSQFKESKCAVRGHSLNQDFTVIVIFQLDQDWNNVSNKTVLSDPGLNCDESYLNVYSQFLILVQNFCFWLSFFNRTLYI